MLILSPKSAFNVPYRTKLTLGPWKGPNHIIESKKISSLLMKVCPSLEPSSKQTSFEVLLNTTERRSLLQCFCMCLHFVKTARIRSGRAKKSSCQVWKSKSQKCQEKKNNSNNMCSLILYTLNVNWDKHLKYFLTMDFGAKLLSLVSNPKQHCRLEVKCNSSYGHRQLANISI